jgi:peptidoglycan/LPS O-acetylase OafA/YrhL
LVATGVACAALIVTHNISLLPSGTLLGASLGLSLLAVLATLCVVDCVRRPDALSTRLLDRPGLRLIGRLSYGMYLVHLPMIDLARVIYYPFSRAATLTNLAGMTLLTTALSVALAGVLYVAIERPFLQLKRHFA